MLSCIRPLPDGVAPAVRGEGVQILLDPQATAAWKKSGEVWEVVSSRLVTDRFKAVCAGQRKPGGSRESKDIYVTVVSAYAPTARLLMASMPPSGIISRLCWIGYHQVTSLSFLGISMLALEGVHQMISGGECMANIE